MVRGIIRAVLLLMLYACGPGEVKVSVEQRADAAAYCQYALRNTYSVACALWWDDPDGKHCKIVISPDDYQARPDIIGHELRHCFEGNSVEAPLMK